MILLDTNVISEALRPQPDPHVVRWLDQHFAESAVTSVTLFELSAGVALMDGGRRRDTLANAISRVTRRFGDRVYAFDATAAHVAAQLLAKARAQGMAIHQIPAKLADLQIAGVAAAYDLALATRNIRDFDGLGLELIDPWSDPSAA